MNKTEHAHAILLRNLILAFAINNPELRFSGGHCERKVEQQIMDTCASWDCERSRERSKKVAGSGKRARDTTLTPGCHDAMFPRSGLPMSSISLMVLCFLVVIVAGLDESET
ncbi:hypothetical protein E2986_13819 [Frieseomelitta varia]|uniref:Uncharacterized protein n=1 Tax=Frieseomelitta varia TaxID=561572 RepID=A0A833SK99_9HYME|nr:hypothetical protein E2986_13819 [Frieseomelitta varia]